MSDAFSSAWHDPAARAHPTPLPRRRLAGVLLICAIGASTAISHSSAEARSSENSFIAENDAVMSRMMADMNVKSSGDIDRDFVDRMVPHHQGAIDMAVLVLKYGRNEQVRRLAQEIIVDQQQEIAALRLAVGETLPASAAAPTAARPASATMAAMPMVSQ